MRCQWILLNTILSLSSLSILLLLLTVHLSPKTVITPLPPIPIQQNFSLLIGVLTRPDLYDKRHFLRMIYGVQKLPPDVTIHIRFVFCRLTNEEQRILIALEILRFNDIITLNCTENMNYGKTYAFFSSLQNILLEQYDYVMKADDDVFIRLEALSASLRKLDRNDLYYGFVLPCQSYDPYSGYMSGMGFILSWDLVQWIAVSNIPAEYQVSNVSKTPGTSPISYFTKFSHQMSQQVGTEDKLVGEWLAMGNKGKNRVTEKPGMYDFPGANGRCSHELIPDTVAVHKLKRWDNWFMVLKYFNLTGVPPSKLYFLDE